MPKPILIIGPAGCGKSLHAEALRQHFGCLSVVDPWRPGIGVVANSLMLTNVRPYGELPFIGEQFDAYEFDHAMRLMTESHAQGLAL